MKKIIVIAIAAITALITVTIMMMKKEVTKKKIKRNMTPTTTGQTAGVVSRAEAKRRRRGYHKVGVDETAPAPTPLNRESWTCIDGSEHKGWNKSGGH